MAVISFTLYPAYISSVVIVGFLFNKSSLNLYFLVVQGLVLYLSLGSDLSTGFILMRNNVNIVAMKSTLIIVKGNLVLGRNRGYTLKR